MNTVVSLLRELKTITWSTWFKFVLGFIIFVTFVGTETLEYLVESEEQTQESQQDILQRDLLVTAVTQLEESNQREIRQDTEIAEVKAAFNESIQTQAVMKATYDLMIEQLKEDIEDLEDN
jgi:hypothetical protein